MKQYGSESCIKPYCLFVEADVDAYLFTILGTEVY